MQVIFDLDLPVAIGDGGVEYSGDNPFDRLRRSDGGDFVDITDLTSFWIDEFGRKHIVNRDGWQELKCRFGDKVDFDGERWFLVSASDDLAHLKAKLKLQVDRSAETERMRYITAGEGQALTYSRKVEEAKRATAEADSKPEEYPMLAASLGIDGDTVKAVAEVVLAMDAAWAIIGSQIERIRLAAKQAVDAAETEGAVKAVLDGIEWPAPQQASLK